MAEEEKGIEEMSNEIEGEPVEDRITISSGFCDSVLLGDKPKMGMIFSSAADALLFYNVYGRRAGFSIRKQKISRSRSDKSKVLSMHLCCSKEGIRRQRLITPNNPRPSIRTGCLASFFVRLVDGGRYVLEKFEESHNHELARLEEVRMLKSQRKVSDIQIGLISDVYNSGILPRKIHNFLPNKAGCSQNLSLPRKDCDNVIQKEHRQYLRRGDAQTVFNHFGQLQKTNPDFRYDIKLDEDDQLECVFWCDARSRVDYKLFSDVVCFDTTFKTNNYDLPYAPFVGVNHHGQSILFGCALLFNETTESFVWCFEAFLKAMDYRQLGTIFTDQAKVIVNAISLVFPDSHHRLCLWHIYLNASQNLGHVFDNFSTFAKEFSDCVYQNETVEEFENAWEAMLAKYELTTNDWLLNLYELKEKWALVYGREYFCAGITTPQRSESMNCYFKKYFRRTLLLYHFVTKYEEAVCEHREAELLEDHSSRQTIPSLASQWVVEVEASKFYPRRIFARFRSEVQDCVNLFVKCIVEDGLVCKYEVTRSSGIYFRTVVFDGGDNTVKCSCKGFEFTGILCSHALKILHTNNVSSLNPVYYLKRWSKDANSGLKIYGFGTAVPDLSEQSFTKRYSRLSHIALTFAMKASSTHESARLGIRELMDGLQKLDLCLEGKKQRAVEAGSTSTLRVKDPKLKRVKSASILKVRTSFQKRPMVSPRTPKNNSKKKGGLIRDEVEIIPERSTEIGGPKNMFNFSKSQIGGPSHEIGDPNTMLTSNES